MIKRRQGSLQAKSESLSDLAPKNPLSRWSIVSRH